MAALKITTIVGARPQFVKAAVLSRTIARHNTTNVSRHVEQRILHTGQHYDQMMSQVFFDEMDLPKPALNLGVGSGRHGATTGAMLAGIENDLLEHRPDWVLVYGDTNSTLAGALAAAKLHLPVAHVEAGLRSFNRGMPEEINRILTDHLAQCLFCPSAAARQQLAREGIEEQVHVVGDVMYDALLYYRQRMIVPARRSPYALATIHRAQNTDDPQRLTAILDALGDCPIPVVLPLHPRTRLALKTFQLTVPPRVEIIPPLSYYHMLGYLAHCCFVLTDSGGLQKEAYFFQKRCITLREETEWRELVECGANRLVGADPDAIRAGFQWARTKLESCQTIYGQGNAGERILQILLA